MWYLRKPISDIVFSVISFLFRCFIFLYPATKCGEVLCYTLRCLSVCPSVRPSAPFPIDNLSIYSRNFAYILLTAMSGMGLLMGKIRPFLTELLPFFVLEKWFLACYSFTVHDI